MIGRDNKRGSRTYYELMTNMVLNQRSLDFNDQCNVSIVLGIQVYVYNEKVFIIM